MILVLETLQMHLNLDTTKGASLRQTSKAKKHPLAKAPFSQSRFLWFPPSGNWVWSFLLAVGAF